MYWTRKDPWRPQIGLRTFHRVMGANLGNFSSVVVRRTFDALNRLILCLKHLRPSQYILKSSPLRFGDIPNCLSDPTHPFSSPYGPYFFFIKCLRNNWTLLNLRNLPKSLWKLFGICEWGSRCPRPITGLRNVQVLHKPLNWFLTCLRNTWTLLNPWTPWDVSLHAKHIPHRFW